MLTSFIKYLCTFLIYLFHDDDDDDDGELLQSYKAAGLRYMVNRSTKTVITVDVALLVVAS